MNNPVNIFSYLVDIFRNDDLSKIIRTWTKVKGRKKLYIRYDSEIILKVIIETGMVYSSSSPAYEKRILTHTDLLGINIIIKMDDTSKEDIQILAQAFYYKHYANTI